MEASASKRGPGRQPRMGHNGNQIPMTQGLAGIDVAVLAGGFGTRLRPAIGDDLPKVLAPVQGRPYLDLLLDWLGGFGVRRTVLCLGHLAETVMDHVGKRAPSGMEIVASVEPRPLGTGGAVAFAKSQLGSDPVMVMNGDSWVDADLNAFVDFHRARNGFASILCVEVPDASRFGTVEVDGDGEVIRFAEKEAGPAKPGLINAGIYLLSPAALGVLADRQESSLERDFLQCLPYGGLSAFLCPSAKFVDIGTPASLIDADTIIAVTPETSP